MPVLFKNELIRNRVYENLKSNYINTRKYFYPSLNEIDIVENSNCHIASDISRRILQLPLFGELGKENVLRICNIIKETIKGSI